jgi:cation-transporting ATPase F
MQTLLGKHWHHLSTTEVLRILESDPQTGLDIFEVQHRQHRFGPNVLTPKRGKSPLVRFLLQFKNPLILILLASSVITALIKDPVDAVIIFAVVLINAVIGYVQESRAEKAIEALAQAMTTETTVIRAGKAQRVSAAELIPGDIVMFQAGDKVPADARLLRSRDLQVAEAVLTGESVPIQKQANAQLLVEAVLAERRTMAYASTLVTYDQGTGVVTATGDDTEVGRIPRLIAEVQKLETPLTRKIAQFSRLVLYAVLALAGITFAVGVLRGNPAVETFTAAVALTVAMIPEGLPAALTVTLAIGVSRMAQRRAIIRKLPAVETLGSITVICSDKTGTLTQNQMTVQQIVAGGLRCTVTGTGYDPAGQIVRENGPVETCDESVALRECLLAGLLCNDSALVEEDGRWEARGDPTEVALIIAARKGGLVTAALEKQLPRLDVIPFDSQHQYMATLPGPVGREDISEERLVYIKGAVEVILERCVAALGLQGMIDPPRQEAISAIGVCQEAGIEVKMITGDHALIAAAVATQIGLAEPCPDSSPPQDCVLTGRAMADYSDAQLIEAAERVAVFARVSPEQKLRLVEALQARGDVVAMTGDGVNDEPALKQPDIGIAMGIAGTEVAKEAADIVVTDDSFATIEAAVEEGRGGFDNLTKIIVWVLPTNVGEGLILLLAILLGIALPILPVHILWINTVTTSVLGLVLALERKEPGIMKRPPRAPNAPILTRELTWRVLLVGVFILAGAFGLYELDLWLGSATAQARTVAVNAIVTIEVLYLFNCRSLRQSMFRVGVFSNRWVVARVAAMVLLQLLFTYAPFMNALFLTAPTSLADWGRVLGVSLLGYLIVELEKWVRRRKA